MLIDKPSNSEQVERIFGAIEKAAAIHRAGAGGVNPIIFVASDVWDLLHGYIKKLSRLQQDSDDFGLEIPEPDSEQIRYHGLEIREQPALDQGIVCHVHPPHLEMFLEIWKKGGSL